MDTVIAIKPHHFVDIITAFGEGRDQFQPHPYGHALHRISRHILDNPAVMLRIKLSADDICLPCCHNINGRCDDTIDISFRPQAPRSKQKYNLLLDRRWCERLGLRQNDHLTARELCQRIQECIGTLTEIYVENPLDKNTTKQAILMKGISEYLKI